MSYPVYQVYAGDVLPVMFATYAGATGASITLTGLAVTDIEIYKDGSATQRASDNGYTLLDTDGIDFDGITGIHGFSIDTGDNSDAGFYTVGAWFHVVVSAVTVDSQTVSFIACAFRLLPAESVAGKPKVDVDAWLGTAAATPTVGGVPEVDVTHWLGSVAPANTGDAFARIGAGGAGLTAVPWNAAWDAEIQSEVDDALVVQRLDELLAADSDIDGAAPPAVGSVFHELLTKTAGSFTYDQATDSLEAIRDKAIDVETDTQDIQGRLPAALVGGRMDSNAQVVADKTGYALSAAGVQAIWDALTSALTTVGSIGKLLVDRIDAAVSSRASQTSLDTLDDYVDTEVAAIKAKTDNLPASPAAVGSAMTLEDGAITAAKIAADAITAAKIAADAIGASELAADAVAEIVAALLTTQMTEAYAADGVAPTLAQALFLLMQGTLEFAINGTVITVKKLDGSTTAATYSLDSSTAPSSRTRAT